MEKLVKISEFYKGKRVLITGHTGFKGAWLSKILTMFGAEVIGYSLRPVQRLNLFEMLDYNNRLISYFEDIRNYDKLKKVVDEHNPEIVFHLAAQPLVIESYKNPQYTFDVNIMGTVNLLECVLRKKSIKSLVNVTTDKVYENNNEDEKSFSEDDRLNGHDPYSNSKSCSELVTNSYYKSFFLNTLTAISTMRAGNVIGGGDFADNRIVPDAMRAFLSNNFLEIRNPNSIRPYQHVLEPLYCYIIIAMKQYEDISYCGSYNIGPDENDCVSTLELIKQMKLSIDINYVVKSEEKYHEANYLKLNNSKIKRKIDYAPRTNISEALELTIDWFKVFKTSNNVNDITELQIMRYFSE